MCFRSMNSKNKTKSCLEEESEGIDIFFQLHDLTMSWTLQQKREFPSEMRTDKECLQRKLHIQTFATVGEYDFSSCKNMFFYIAVEEFE